MPTESSETVTITPNAEGDFVCVIQSQSIQTVTITKEAMLEFIRGQDTATPPPPAT